MPEMYNAYNNNCQTFVISLLDIICRAGRKKVNTSYSLTTLQMAYVPTEGNTIPEDEEIEVAITADGIAQAELLAKVQEIMDENTPKLTPEQNAELNRLAEANAS